MSDEIATVGWDAIDQALAQVYGEQGQSIMEL